MTSTPESRLNNKKGVHGRCPIKLRDIAMRKIHGFTLMEIFITLIIIAVLTGIVTVGYNLMPSRETLRKDSAAVKSLLLTARMRAINSGTPYGVMFETATGDYYVVRDPLGAAVAEGPFQSLDSRNSFSSTDFVDDFVIFNIFGELSEDCLLEEETEGEIYLTNPEGNIIRLNILLTTGRVKEYLR